MSGHTDSYSQSMMYVHQSLLRYDKITGPWKIGHADLHFMTHKSMSQGWAMSDQLSA